MESNRNHELMQHITSASDLPSVSAQAAEAYAADRNTLVSLVNESMMNRKDLSGLLGGNSVEMMTMNHENHAAFMANVFLLNQFEMLAKTIIWVYRSYKARGFSYDYFPVELKAWMEAIRDQLDSQYCEQILAIYQWMIDAHERTIYLSELSFEDVQDDISPENPMKQHFLEALLNADHAEALAMAREVKQQADFESFLLDVIQPSMYEIGRLWEKGLISVAQEHLASSIVGRVMSQLYIANMATKPSKGIAVITTAPNEFHELGAWMVSDLLELDGWRVRYLGANSPLPDLVKLILDIRPQVLALSVTMPFNLDKVRDVIGTVRKNEELDSVKIIVGGGIFKTMPNIWSELGADAAAGNAREAVSVANSLCA